MTKTYQNILKQIESLQAEAERLRNEEVEGVIKRIREAIAAYGLTAADLGLGAGRKARAAGKPGRKPGRPKKAAAGKPGRKVAPKYRDDKGNTWAGRGKRPVWLRDALAAGRKLEDFAVK